MRRIVRVAGVSMTPTLRPSDLLLVAPVGRAVARPRRGAVVVLRRDGTAMIKRVVAVPGDVVALTAGRLAVNGAPVDGRPPVRGAHTRTWRVPPGRVFVAGDNAAASDDSRVWDEPFVPVADVDAVVARRLPRLRRTAATLSRRRPAAGARPAR